MPTYITVLDSNAGLQYWRAIQTANSLAAIKGNRYYTAGINISIPKSPGDSFVENKRVTEVLTGATASAGIYRIASSGSNGVMLMAGNASKSFLKKIQSKKEK